MRLDEISQQPTVDRQAILAELAKLGIKSISTINDDGSVDVQGNALIPTEYTSIPVQFRNVSGDFFCDNTQLTSLKGSPVWVGSVFRCNHTQIASLQYAPQHVGSGFSCSETRISSLQYAPRYVGGSLWCKNTRVKSLEYAPQYVGGNCWYSSTGTTTLQNIHKTNSDWVLDGILHLNRHCTHLLGLAYIKGVKQVQLGHLDSILVIHDVFEWQEKLLELGLVEQAQL